MSKVTLENGSLVIETPYNQMLVMEIKGLPHTERKWDGARKAWLVDPRHANRLAGWIAQYLGEMVMMPQLPSKTAQPEINLFDVRYIGATKEKSPGVWAAAGLTVDGDWTLVFPEKTLRAWFELDDRQISGQPTLYGTLGVRNDASDSEIKTAFRRMARQWHPDVCKEAGAADMFMRIKDAYDVLSTPDYRLRYDAGLMLAMSVDKVLDKPMFHSGYRPLLRCGYILAETLFSVGRHKVNKILQWEDITNDSGQTLVTSWPAGAKSPVEGWV